MDLGLKGKVALITDGSRGIGKPVIVDPSVFFGFTKLGRYMLDDGEGWFFRSDNILTERDVEKIEWQMLPEGDHVAAESRRGAGEGHHADDHADQGAGDTHGQRVLGAFGHAVQR